MYISKTEREIVKLKYSFLCAYSGTRLESDWQVDHVFPVRRNLDGTALNEHFHDIDNMLPAQKLINHYKHSMNLEDFRLFMKTFHLRLAKLPKKTRIEKTKKRIVYMSRIASYFGITPEIPFSGTFYFETIKKNPKFFVL